jgi:hypothetical protein
MHRPSIKLMPTLWSLTDSPPSASLHITVHHKNPADLTPPTYPTYRVFPLHPVPSFCSVYPCCVWYPPVLHRHHSPGHHHLSPRLPQELPK